MWTLTIAGSGANAVGYPNDTQHQVAYPDWTLSHYGGKRLPSITRDARSNRRDVIAGVTRPRRERHCGQQTTGLARIAAAGGRNREAKLVTYIIQSEKGGPVKIGKATDLPSRLAGLQTGNPEKLFVVGWIDGDVESELHRRFASSRIPGGEWFRITDDFEKWVVSDSRLIREALHTLSEEKVDAASAIILQKIDLPHVMLRELRCCDRCQLVRSLAMDVEVIKEDVFEVQRFLEEWYWDGERPCYRKKDHEFGECHECDLLSAGIDALDDLFDRRVRTFVVCRNRPGRLAVVLKLPGETETYATLKAIQDFVECWDPVVHIDVYSIETYQPFTVRWMSRAYEGLYRCQEVA